MNPSSSDTFPPLYTTSPRHLTLASPLPLGSGAPAAARLPITFKPVATKAEKFAELSRLDRHKLERPKAHFRNALKTTEGLERVTKQLDKVRHSSWQVDFAIQIDGTTILSLKSGCNPKLH